MNVFKWMLALLCAGAISQASAALVMIDPVTAQRIDSALHLPRSAAGDEAGARIAAVSAQFLGVPYRAQTLIGSPMIPEKLVVDLRAVDCFTYLDYVEALRRSSSYAGFVQNLVQTRYNDNQVSYYHRRHFFTDWATTQPVNAYDVTRELSAHSVGVTKDLNRKADGSAFLPQLGVTRRQINYIPSRYVDQALLARLRTGDYIGIYTAEQGLDVTHAGIFIATAQGPMLRNASLRVANMKVVDSPFMAYIKSVPGIVVLRPMPIRGKT